MKTLVVIDPGTRIPELDCFNRLARNCPIPATYHLPAQQGSDSLHRIDSEVAGIVMFGSGASVHDDEAWQHEMDAWLMPRVRAGVPFLGLCYGHQHLAHRMGGDVGFVAEDHEKIRGVRITQLAADPLWGDACSGPMVVSHREVVTRLPEGFRVVGHRDRVAIDAFSHASLPVWGFQPHPEATTAFTSNNGIPFEDDPAILSFGHGMVDAFTRWCAGRDTVSA